MKKPRHYSINYPERECINCGAIIPARTFPKKVCSNACAGLAQTRKIREKEKLLWKQLREQEQKDITEEPILQEPIPQEPTSVTMADRWAKVYHNSSQEALRELAGLKVFRIKHVETWGNPLHLLKTYDDELFALRKG